MRKACEKLWALDENRAQMGSEVVLDLQNPVKVYSLCRAPQSMLCHEPYTCE